MTDTVYNGAPPYETVKWDTASKKAQGGLFLGYNMQRGATVYGIEAGLAHHAMSETALQPGVDIYGDPYDLSAVLKGGTSSALSLRLGHARDRNLFYLKAGAIYSDAKIGLSDSCVVSPCGDTLLETEAKLGWGYQLGLGVEHALADDWSLRAEYTYADFGKTKLRGDGNDGFFDGVAFDFPAKLSTQSLSIGVSYRF